MHSAGCVCLLPAELSASCLIMTLSVVRAAGQHFGLPGGAPVQLADIGDIALAVAHAVQPADIALAVATAVQTAVAAAVPPAVEAAMQPLHERLRAEKRNKSIELENRGALLRFAAVQLRLLRRIEPTAAPGAAVAAPAVVGGPGLPPAFVDAVAAVGGLHVAAPVGAIPGEAPWPVAAYAFPAVFTNADLTLSELSAFACFYGTNFGIVAGDTDTAKNQKFRRFLAGETY